MSETRYPLLWPSYVPRTKDHARKRAAFKSPRQGTYPGPKTMAAALSSLQAQMDNLAGASQMVLSSNVVLRLDGFPRSDQAKPKDPGAALYLNRNGKRLCFPCDKWERVEDNIYAIAMHLDAMRGMERWGVGTTEQAFAGYKALSAGEDWWDVLGCSEHSEVEQINSAYWKLAQIAHPDKPGGSSDAMARLNKAREEAFAALKATVA